MDFFVWSSQPIPRLATENLFSELHKHVFMGAGTAAAHGVNGGGTGPVKLGGKDRSRIGAFYNDLQSRTEKTSEEIAPFDDPVIPVSRR